MPSENYSYTGSLQTFDVPDGVFEVDVSLEGERAGGSDPAGRVEGSLSVTPGETLHISVGGGGGWPDGGDGGSISGATANNGGGSSDIRQGGFLTL